MKLILRDETTGKEREIKSLEVDFDDKSGWCSFTFHLRIPKTVAVVLNEKLKKKAKKI